MKIDVELKKERRTEPFDSDDPLTFASERTDHIFYLDGKVNPSGQVAWTNPRIEPYAEMKGIMPGAVVFHYGVEIFEGAKAFEHPDGELYTFRLRENAERLNRSAAALCIPAIPVEDQLQAVNTLLDIDRLWSPRQEGASLYIRPAVIGVTDAMGITSGTDFRFMVFASAGGAYYAQGFNPITLLHSHDFKRAAPNNFGMSKAGGIYGLTVRHVLEAKKKAEKAGFNPNDVGQVLYSSVDGKFVEEAGAMNHYCVLKNGNIVIPEFTNTILDSITARSFIEEGENALGREVVQATIPLEDFFNVIKSGEVVEAGGLGTAAVVSPVGTYLVDQGEGDLEELVVGDGGVGPVTQQMYDWLTGVQTGKVEAPEDWLQKVPRTA
ncbi:branched-chain amino acid aminotransferase [archaeon]|nr:branched-chain amino acid aminotransferase [archaeon]